MATQGSLLSPLDVFFMYFLEHIVSVYERKQNSELNFFLKLNSLLGSELTFSLAYPYFFFF